MMINWKDIFIRAGKTFIQAFVPIVIATISTLDVTNIGASKSVIFSALLSACAAGISAGWNIISQALQTEAIETDEEEYEDINLDELTDTTEY